MIGELPKTLTVDKFEYDICSDFRPALRSIMAFEDSEISAEAKFQILLINTYGEDNIPNDTEEAIRQAIWFLDCGKEPDEQGEGKKSPRLMSWAKDEQLIFSSINKKAGYSVRQCEYLHWWDFVGLFLEPCESFFSQVLAIRAKRAKGKKLEKYEKDFYEQNKDIVDLKTSKQEQDEIEKILQDYN
jgi:Bacteriophage Gp15 protein.